MTAILFIILVLVVLAAIGFALAPLWRARSLKGRGILAAAITLFLLGVGGGTYFMLGQPYLAWRTAQDPEQWLNRAAEKPGSWWPHWGEWLARHGGGERAAPEAAGNAQFQPLAPAPGVYVKEVVP